LKLGLYTCVGVKTCRGNRPGSFGHYDQDAKTFVDWGVDFVKSDFCNRPSGWSAMDLYSNFSLALNKTGKPILFSLCNWGDQNVVDWGFKYGQMFRVQMDHIPFWDFPPKAAGMGFGQGTANIIEYMATLPPSKYIKQYGWLDPDFLETMMPITLPFTESRTEYSFWSLWSSPLIVATDIRKLNDQKKSILMNPEVIAIDQDPLWTAGDRIANYTKSGQPGQIWGKPLSNGDYAVILYNPSNSTVGSVSITVTWDQIGWPASAQVSVRDLWARKDMGTFGSGGFSSSVAPHDVFFMRATRKSADTDELEGM